METLGERLKFAVLPRLGYGYIRLLQRTMKLEYRNREVIDRIRVDPGAYILTFWHSRFVMMPYGYIGDRLVSLSSTHRDSRMLAQILRHFGFASAWGSSTEGGARGLRQVLRHVRDGYDVSFTPDGPRGPRRRVKAGVVATAKLTGLPIVPTSFSAFPARRLRSWDRTLLPRPFSRGVYAYGEPIRVDRRADDAEIERVRLAVEQELDRLTDGLDEECGIGPEEPRTPVESG